MEAIKTVSVIAAAGLAVFTVCGSHFAHRFKSKRLSQAARKADQDEYAAASRPVLNSVAEDNSLSCELKRLIEWLFVKSFAFQCINEFGVRG